MAGGSVGFYVGISILVLKYFPPKAVTLSEKYYHWKSIGNDSTYELRNKRRKKKIKKSARPGARHRRCGAHGRAAIKADAGD